MVLRKNIVTIARSYVGTPFHHQARLKGIGIDCVGLLYCVAVECGIKAVDCTTYSRTPDGVTLQTEIEKSVDPLPLSHALPGDILVFRLARHPCHVGIKSDYGVIHTYGAAGKVVEHGLQEPWLSRLCGAYRYRGVEPTWQP